MPISSVPDLTLHMLPHRHTILSNALYTSPHGGPIRMLPLVLESGTVHYELHIPCFALYNRFSNPTLTTTAMTRADWNTLHTFVEEEGVLKVIFSPDESKTNFLGKLTVLGGEDMGVEEGSVGIRFSWQENTMDGGVVGARIKRGLEWVRGKVGELR